MRQKVAFITGISGQDGSLLAEYLLKKNYRVIGLLRSESNTNNLSEIIESDDLELIYGDLMNSELLRYILTKNIIDEVYNLASQSNVRKSYDNPVHTFNVTIIGTVQLLDSIKKYSKKTKVFQASSSSMFGSSTDTDGVQREGTPFKPMSPYASAKLFAHNICQNYRDNDGLFISSGILYNHESIKSKTLPGFLNTIITKGLDIKQEKIKSFHVPNLNISIDWGHAEDYVKAMWLCLQQEKPDDYIISSGRSYTLEFMCDWVFSKLGLDWKKYITTEQNNHSDFTRSDNSKILSLGWSPKFTLDEMIDQFIDFHIKNKKINE